MVQDMDYGALKLTPKAWDLFKGKLTFRGTLTTTTLPADIGHQPMPQSPNTHPDFDPELFNILRKQRKILADKAQVPPFIVFSDKTLMELATWFPQSPERFRQIHGIGQTKAQKYGPIFLEGITQYCEKKGIAERQFIDKPEQNNPLSSKCTQVAPKRRYIEVSEAYNKGQSIQQLMVRFNVRRNTIINHLFNYCRKGYALRCDGLMEEIRFNKETQKRVMATFDSLGSEQLRPVYQALNQSIAYDDLHLLRLYHLNCKNKEHLG